MTQDRTNLFVCAYPKAGSSWLTRLLADCLNSPSGGCMPAEDRKEMASEGWDRPGPWVVRKGHYIPIVKRGDGPTIPAPHCLAWNRVRRTGEPVVMLVRDPRDVAVAGAHHWGTNPMIHLEDMAHGIRSMRALGDWNEFVLEWMHMRIRLPRIARTKYEDLLADPEGEVRRVLSMVRVKFDEEGIGPAVERQSFAARKAWTERHGGELPLGKAHNLLMMRKGIAGDWRNHFGPRETEFARKHFGRVMRMLDYGDW